MARTSRAMTMASVPMAAMTVASLRDSPTRSRLGHIPEHRERRLDHAGDSLPPSLITFEKPGRDIDHVVHRGLVQFHDGLLLGCQVRRRIPGGDLFLHQLRF